MLVELTVRFPNELTVVYNNELVGFVRTLWMSVDVRGHAVRRPAGVRDAHVPVDDAVHVKTCLLALDAVPQHLHLTLLLDQGHAILHRVDTDACNTELIYTTPGSTPGSRH